MGTEIVNVSPPYPMVGVMFFSILTKKSTGSWISSRENDWEEHVKNILEIDRLRFRLKLMKEVTIPQFQDQTLPPSSDWFKFIIITSKLLPDEIKKELYQIQSENEWLEIQERGVDDWLAAEPAVATAIKNINFSCSGKSFPFLSFRLDDDDFLPLNYLEKTQQYIRLENVNKLITYENGYKVLWDMESSALCNIADNKKSFLALGLGAVCEADTESRAVISDIKSVYVGKNHFELGGEYSHIIDESDSMYVWSHHPSQDTFGRFKSSSFEGRWDSPPSNIQEILSSFPHLLKFIPA